MPPARAFWSATLYDLENGFFIPNEQKKYSVGENAGYNLDKDGGIRIVVAAERPEGVPEENWLPISRSDLDINDNAHRGLRIPACRRQALPRPGSIP